MFAILLTFVSLVYLRKKLLESSDLVDQMAWTPSDFALLGYCPGFSEKCDYSVKSITKEVREYMRVRFDIDEIEYVNVAYDIANIYELFAQEQQYQKEKELIKWYCGQKNWT